jgi:Cd2+/Zn2+-exporting ATPase
MLHSAGGALMEGVFGIDVLATVAVLASMYVGEYVAAAIVVLMLGGGEVLEDYTSGRASTAIEKLIEASPQSAVVVRDGKEVEVSVNDVKVGETVIIKPGGLIPVDGVVISGRASVNQSSVTGESMPMERSEGAKVFSGTMVELGTLEVEVTAVGEETTFNKIIKMVSEAEEHKAPIERAADRFAKYFTPIILGLGVIVYILTGSILRVASLWVISCPCALTLATPMAVVASIGNSASKGILIRNGESLETMSSVDVVAMDKTGTITTGEPKVVGVKTFGVTETEVMEAAATAESRSEHPLATAILRKAEEMGVRPGELVDFEVHPGLGVKVEAEDGEIIVGNSKMLSTYSITPDSEAQPKLEAQGSEFSHVFVVKNGNVLGILQVSDTIRDDAGKTLSIMKKYVEKTVMLTGDIESVAQAIGDEAGVDEVLSGLLPSEKVDYIRSLKSTGQKVVMVGDGINDAPALASADVGVAMGLSGTDVAIETAGIVLSSDDISKLPVLLRIGKETMKIIKQNLFFAMAVNLIGIGLSITGMIPPLVASVIHESNALVVMINSLRLLRVK